MSHLNVGLVGHGHAAAFHLPSFRRLGEGRCRVVAVCGRSEARARAFAEANGIPQAFGSLAEMLSGVDIDLVDVIVPNHVHGEHIIAAAEAGKHIICEKPLTGYFGEPDSPEEARVGDTVPRRHMFRQVVKECDAVERAVVSAGVKFGYAENWVYAPSFAKLRRLAAAAGGAILRLEAEESHSGSPSIYAKRWRTGGGGSLMLKGSHPLGAVLHLKQWEGRQRGGRPIRPSSVICEVGNLTFIEAFTQEERHYVKTDWQDVEDWGLIVIKFEDGSVAEIKASDTTLGGVHNYLEAYLSNARIRANINPSNACVAYAPEDHVFGDEYITEKTETKGGWSFPSPDENWNQGYPQEIADFVAAVVEDREPLSGLLLARDVALVLYAAYVSAEEGRRVEVSELASGGV